MSHHLSSVSRVSQVSQFSLPALPQCSSGKTKITVGVALGALLLFAGALYFSRKRKSSLHIISTEEHIKSILPKGESLLKIEKVEGGFSNNLWRVDTATRLYIFRSPKMRDDPSRFMQLLQVSKYAFENGISPQIVGENVKEQQMLLEYIDHNPWPSYEENSVPYKTTMKVLRCFHEKMQPFAHKVNDTDPAPFALIFNEGDKLAKTAGMPTHFSSALKKVERIFDRLKPWLKNHATLCHGDFHKGNVLLSKAKGFAPVLIDFDSMSMGDPFFDVAKFSLSLPQKYRLELFKEYLGGRLPTPQEQAHFELMDLALLMVIASVRFKSVQNVQGNSQERLSKTEIEEMLNSEDPLPSFLKMPFGDTSPKARQKGATYALGEFLKRTNALSFSRLIDNVVV